MTTTNLYVYKDLNKNAEYMKDEVGESVSYDVSYREIVVLDTKIRLYYVNGLVDGIIIAELLKMLVRTNDNEKETDKIDDIIQNRLVNEQRSEEHTSELQSRGHLVCRLLLEKKKKRTSLNNIMKA